MTRKWIKRMIRIVLPVTVSGGMLMPSCITQVKIPGGRVDVSPAGVFVDFLGLSVSVTDDQVLIDAPGVEVDVRGDIY